MSYPSIPIWKEAPFIRLIIPMTSGILIEWHACLPVWIYELVIPSSILFIFLFSFLRSFTRFKNYWMSGIMINILLLGIAGLVTRCKDLRHDPGCITEAAHAGGIYTVTLLEPLSEKEKSFKATGQASLVYYNDTLRKVKGSIIVYFQKDTALKQLTYNSRIAFRRNLQPIKNSGNPGAFDYQRYCIFQGIFYQVYLKPGDYIILPGSNDHVFTGMLFKMRRTVVKTLQSFIPGDKEAGLAEALLIGYKDDLDKNLVQSYSNTGVVHIIAISGLHLGLIYWLLNLLFAPLKTNRRSRIIKAVLILSGLWLFSILTGGSASVCRSALMFSLIVMGENIGRKTNVYNSLAASAFLLLCYNPYWLWDAGFQLSYIAVLSIIIFMKPVYNWFYIKNKLLDHTWKMAAISIAAQILTTPVSIFHFQQFPNYFLITNLVAVPLSSLVVLAEITVCAVSFFPTVAKLFGAFTSWLIEVMNGFVDYINKMPLTVTSELQLSLVELILMYLFIAFITCWLFYKNKPAFISALCFISCLLLARSYHVIMTSNQQKLIVYNIPHRQAIDIVNGRRCLFIGDAILQNDQALQNFIFKPCRNENMIQGLKQFKSFSKGVGKFVLGKKEILLVKGDVDKEWLPVNYSADLIILSANADIPIATLRRITNCSRIIFDCSNSTRQIEKWKEACRNADIAFYSVPENGAFILNLN